MTHLMALLFQQDAAPPAAGGAAVAAGLGIFMIIYVVIILAMIAGMWKLFSKAGEPGWAAIVPIYNIIVFLKIAGKPAWWFLILWLVIPWFIASIGVAKNFGKETGFGIGIALLPFVCIPILGFGDAKYQPTA